MPTNSIAGWFNWSDDGGTANVVCLARATVREDAVVVAKVVCFELEFDTEVGRAAMCAVATR